MDSKLTPVDFGTTKNKVGWYKTLRSIGRFSSFFFAAALFHFVLEGWAVFLDGWPLLLEAWGKPITTIRDLRSLENGIGVTLFWSVIWLLGLGFSFHVVYSSVRSVLIYLCPKEAEYLLSAEGKDPKAF
jgi:hypothetical protein